MKGVYIEKKYKSLKVEYQTSVSVKNQHFHRLGSGSLGRPVPICPFLPVDKYTKAKFQTLLKGLLSQRSGSTVQLVLASVSS